MNGVVSKRIWVTFQKEGFHRYPEAATRVDLCDVAFLANMHRHMFHFRVEISVEHDNRDIEFIQFKRMLEGWYDSNKLDIDNRSCEALAGDLCRAILVTYPGRSVTVEVSEDGENGASVQMMDQLRYSNQEF